MADNAYVYVHHRLDTNAPFYVGKGSGKRATSKKDRNTYWHNIVNKVGFKSVILQNGLTHQQALNAEKFIIASLRNKYKLANLTAGGDGGNGLSGSSHPLYGKPRSEKTKKKLSDALIGRSFAHCSNRVGTIQTDETKAKISASLKGKVKSQKHIDAVSAALKKTDANKKPRKPLSEETKIKISLAQKGKKLTEAHRIALCKPKKQKVL